MSAEREPRPATLAPVYTIRAPASDEIVRVLAPIDRLRHR